MVACGCPSMLRMTLKICASCCARDDASEFVQVAALTMTRHLGLLSSMGAWVPWIGMGCDQSPRTGPCSGKLEVSSEAGCCCVPVRLLVLLPYGVVYGVGWPEAVDGVGCGQREQCACVSDRLAHGAVWVYSGKPVLHWGLRVQYSVVGEVGEQFVDALTERKTKAGPSTALRCAQDDGVERRAGPSTSLCFAQDDGRNENGG